MKAPITIDELDCSTRDGLSHAKQVLDHARQGRPYVVNGQRFMVESFGVSGRDGGNKFIRLDGRKLSEDE